MTRDTWAYREVAVESYVDRRGKIGIRPMAGQAFAPTMPVQCGRKLRDNYPPGTRFLLNAKLTDRLGGPHFWRDLYRRTHGATCRTGEGGFR